ncbi:MAG: PilT/PilU family type 4a pilus ATPase, partial [Casimicrobium sp.]
VLQPAVEVLLNTKLVADMIAQGDLPKVKEAMEQSLTTGSCTFEQALSKLYLGGAITYEDALIAADSPTNLAWIINQSQQNQATSSSRDRSSSVANFESFELSTNRAAETTR